MSYIYICPRCEQHRYRGGCMCKLGDMANTTTAAMKPNTPLTNTITVSSSTDRKNTPVFSGVMMYFPDALEAIAKHSKKGNDKHNPGQPMHWAKEKSADHADAMARHLIDIGPNWNAVDEETGSYHAVALAWRALALLQTLLDKEKANKQ